MHELKQRWIEYREKIGEKALLEAYALCLQTLAAEIPSKKIIKKYLFDNDDQEIILENLVKRRKVWWMTQGSIIDTVENSLHEAFANDNFREEIIDFAESKRLRHTKKKEIK